VQPRASEFGVFLPLFANIAVEDFELVDIRLALVSEKAEVVIVHLGFLQDADEIVV
jgi:hypothetical protein